ncbi:hypothetical protein Moror_10331 [Moniliophthora roreri MCA 2997]|uniref:Uncharacterized protein n=1 Tax=Moniliophthora roreri (strain MCA 2997) TaxID=1381753 RepID=V2XE95_MONRO|nr:hypothetical protein Moror_10331 [Moniliophthora roreri MCA 2997]
MDSDDKPSTSAPIRTPVPTATLASNSNSVYTSVPVATTSSSVTSATSTSAVTPTTAPTSTSTTYTPSTATSTADPVYSPSVPVSTASHTPAHAATRKTSLTPGTYSSATGSTQPLSQATIQALLSQAAAAQAATAALPNATLPKPPSASTSSSGSSYYTTSSSNATSTNSNPATGQSYFDPNSAVWKNSTWAATLAAYPYAAQQLSAQYSQQYGFPHYQSGYQNQYKAGSSTTGTPKVEQKIAPKPRTPSPPPPEPPRDWDVLLRRFLQSLGLTQALQGLELDILVLNEDWEAKHIAVALDDLVKGIQTLRDKSPEDQKDIVVPEKPLEERKLDYVHLSNGAKPSSPTAINKSISEFLARKRANNDASNRNEFLLSIAQKRAKLSEDSEMSKEPSSCARTDAKYVNRECQMKYDIAKNEDGPLRRTMRSKNKTEESDMQPPVSTSKVLSSNSAVEPMQIDSIPTTDRHHALDERLTNIESHFAVRYVPSPPLNLLDRLKLLEDHIIRLEKDYPPWAAIHFSQPNRVWPPPPQVTPIIVPTHLTRDLSKKPTDDQAANTEAQQLPKSFRKDSSLHRALLERLEIKNAKNALASRS